MASNNGGGVYIRYNITNFNGIYSRNGSGIMSDVDILTAKLIEAGATRDKVIAIVDGYGDSIDWTRHSLDSIIGEVWNSDTNSGNDPDGWIINEICRTFNINEVKE